MSQSKKMSIIESATQTVVAFLLSVAVQPTVYSWYGWDVSYYHSAELAVVFTVISLVRGYIIRRCFI